LITVAGTVIADFFARTLAGEPPRGFLTVIDEIGFHLGGAAPNTGAVLARLNVPVSLVGSSPRAKAREDLNRNCCSAGSRGKKCF